MGALAQRFGAGSESFITRLSFAPLRVVCIAASVFDLFRHHSNLHKAPVHSVAMSLTPGEGFVWWFLGSRRSHP